MLLIQILGGCAAAALLYALYTLCSNIYSGVAGWFAARRKKNEEWNEMVADLDAKESAKKHYQDKKKGAKKTTSQKNRHRKSTQYSEDVELDEQPAAAPVTSKSKKADDAPPEWMLQEDHELAIVQLKGYKQPLLSVSCSSDGQCIASCSRERCILIHPQQNLSKKPNPKRINIDDGTYATHVAISTKVVCGVMADSGAVRAYAVDGSNQVLCEFDPGHLPKQPIKGFQMTDTALAWDSAAHRHMQHDALTVLTHDSQTLFRVHALNWVGNELSHTQTAAIDTKKVVNYDVAMNRHARFVAVGNFTDCKIWEMDRKSEKALSSNLFISFKALSVGIHPDGTRIALGGAKGVLQLFDLEVDGARGETPKKLWQADGVLSGREAHQLQWSPNGKTIAVCDSNTIEFVSAASGKVVGAVRAPHKPLVHAGRGDPSMASMSWLADSSGVVTGGTDKLLKVWRNPN